MSGSGQGTSSRSTTSSSNGFGADVTGVKLDAAPPGDSPLPKAPQLDVLIVIDDGPTMLAEQGNVAHNFVTVAKQIQDLAGPDGLAVHADTHIMVTHTSVASSVCNGDGGAPVTSTCIERIDAFSDAAGADAAFACEEACPNAVVPSGEFIRFARDVNNLSGAIPVDLDGDGTPESAVAQALSCIGPQGFTGCAYGSPLEAMRIALDLGAPWNVGVDPFLRENTPLAVILIADGLDCSGLDAPALEDDAWWEVDPSTGEPAPSEAICWNAGVDCNEPDAAGQLTNCTPSAAPLIPTEAYVEFLAGLRKTQSKTVFMFGAVGVPPVTEHGVESPFEPTEGGVEALEVREWSDADLNPADVMAGVTTADKRFEVGVGPGCTAIDRREEVIGQGAPPLRIIDVCRSLDGDTDASPREFRCCLESICDASFRSLTNCLHALQPPIYAE